MKKILMAGLCLCSLTLAAQDPNSVQLRKLYMVYTALQQMYVDTLPMAARTETAIKAMVAELDPHTAYMSPDEIREMREPLQGGFDGVGISFNLMKDTLYVVEVIPGGPASKVGMLAGDRVLYIDGENVAGVNLTNSGVQKRLKGPKGTEVEVTVKRRGVEEPIVFRIVRDKIPLNTLDAAFMAAPGIGYIRLSRFGATTHEEFLKAFDELEHQKMKYLILDLQSNGGGYMSAALELLDEFLPSNRLLVYTEGAHSPRQNYLSYRKGCYEKGSLIVLTDDYSASSSEIVAGAVQDWDRGLVVGRRSFGKGLVQNVIDLGDGSALKLTTSRYHTPSGRCIQKPYDGGEEEYRQDLNERYLRGEMMSADSIRFADSLRYATLKEGRTVYGGGGIMPDVFVPLDTTQSTPLHRLLSNRGVVLRYSLQYVDRYRSDIKARYPKADDFIRGFVVDDAMMEEMRRLATEEKVATTDTMWQADQTLLRLQTKAYLARDLYSTADYVRVMQVSNEALQQAIRILQSKELRKKYRL